MLPRWHIIFGGAFTLLLWLAVPGISWIYLLLVFLASFLIDFDHYAASVLMTERLSLKESFKYHESVGRTEIEEKKRGIRRRGDFHLFHTVEFHLLVGLLGLVWIGFFYIFIGMIFHSLLDVVDLTKRDTFYRREFFFFNWLGKKVFG